MFEQYWLRTSMAFADFDDRNWRCEYKSSVIKRCVNVLSRHQKGHQSEKGEIEGGSWTCNQTSEAVEEKAKTYIRDALTDMVSSFRIQREGSSCGKDHLREVYQCHKRNLHEFYSRWEKGNSFKSHTICFSCLFGFPEHILPCGHMICTPCATAYGTPLRAGFTKIDGCPLGHHKEKGWNESQYLASTKPDQAGVRMLTLDG